MTQYYTDITYMSIFLYPQYMVVVAILFIAKAVVVIMWIMMNVEVSRITLETRVGIT
jgi:hypothetical protein